MGNESLYNFAKTTKSGKAYKIKQLNYVFDNVLPQLSSGSTLLEAGSGRGEFADIVAERNVDYIGIEPSDSLRADLESRGYRILSSPLPAIQLDDACVDLVYSYDVVEHLGDYSTVLAYFSEASRVLKPGGHIVVIVPNAETIGHLFYLYEYQHSFFTCLDRMETMLEDTGFSITSARPFLTGMGLSKSPVIRIADRVIANTLLLFARSVVVTSLMRFFLGRELVFKIHKNLYDHVAVVARKE